MPKLAATPPQTLLPGSRAVVFGLTGSGKTRLVRSILPAHSRLLVIDPLHEYGRDAVAVASLSDLQTYLRRTAGRWRICYQGDDLDEEFETLCDVAQELGDCLFVVEETDLFCDPNRMPDRFAALIKYGRHRRVYPLCVSRTPSEVHRLVTRQAYEVYSFTVGEPRDLDYLRRYVGERFADGLDALPFETYRSFNRWTRDVVERRLGEPLTSGRTLPDTKEESREPPEDDEAAPVISRAVHQTEEE